MHVPAGAPEPVKNLGTMVASVESVWMPVVGSEADDTPEPGAITFRTYHGLDADPSAIAS